MKLPSKKIIPISLSCVIALAIIVFSLHFDKKTEAQKADPVIKNESEAVSIATDQTLSEDTDHDGLKNWEEVLWKTDIHNPDTDGDGMKDGEEVGAGRDPVVKGVGNPSSLGLAKNNSNNSSDENLNTTDKAARDLFATYVGFKQAGVAITPQTQQALINVVASQEGEQAVVYKEKDIHINSSANAGDIFEYGNLLGKMIRENSAGVSGDEIDILGIALKNDDEKKLKELEPIIGAYKKTLKSLQAVSVPQNATVYHLEFMNALSITENSIVGMRNMFLDPVNGSIQVKNYLENSKKLAQSFVDLTKYFVAQGISYQSDEDGYTITHSVTVQ